MKSLTLALAFALLAVPVLPVSAAPGSPAATILADYQAKAMPAMEKLNGTLTKQGSTVAAEFVSKGDTATAEEVTAQIKQKTASEVIQRPHPALITLLAQYDAARAAVLKPYQTAAFAKIDAALKSAAGKDLAAVTELGKAREEIESGKVVTATAASSASDRNFAGRSWFTKAGSEYHFNKDGSGYRIQKMDFDGKVPFTWKQRPDGVVEALQRKQPTGQPTPTFFRFDDLRTGFQGESATTINSPLTGK